MAQTTATPYGCLTHYKTAGTFYDVGFNTGSHFRERMRAFLSESDHHQKTVLPTYHSPAGREFYEESLRVTQKCFPRYLRELHGLADGAGVPFEHMFMANVCERNIEFLLTGKAASPPGQNDPEYGCSTIFISSQETRVIVHNEDHHPLVKKYGFLVSADICEDGHAEKFTAFCFPSSLPGRAFSVNHRGLVVTSNALHPATLQRESISRHFLTRALVGAQSVEEAVHQARNEPFGSAYGFSANLCSKEGRLLSLEVGPGKPRALVHVQEIPPSSPSPPLLLPEEAADGAGHYFHFNVYNHLQLPQLGKMQSSARRAQRVSELPTPRRLQDALNMAADTQDQLSPLYRTPRPSDPGQTVCTAAFDALANQLSLYEDREQLLANTPVLKIPMFV